MVWLIFTNATAGASIKPTFEFKSTAISALNSYGIRSVPVVVVDGRLAWRCETPGPRSLNLRRLINLGLCHEGRWALAPQI